MMGNFLKSFKKVESTHRAKTYLDSQCDRFVFILASFTISSSGTGLKFSIRFTVHVSNSNLSVEIDRLRFHEIERQKI